MDRGAWQTMAYGVARVGPTKHTHTFIVIRTGKRVMSQMSF